MERWFLQIEAKSFELTKTDDIWFQISEPGRGFQARLRLGVSELPWLIEQILKASSSTLMDCVVGKSSKEVFPQYYSNGEMGMPKCKYIQPPTHRYHSKGKDLAVDLGGQSSKTESSAEMCSIVMVGGQPRITVNKALESEEMLKSAIVVSVSTGLPFHLWKEDVFNKIGELCGGLADIHNSTINLSFLSFAIIRVKEGGTLTIPRMVTVQEKGKLYPVEITIISVEEEGLKPWGKGGSRLVAKYLKVADEPKVEDDVVEDGNPKRDGHHLLSGEGMSLTNSTHQSQSLPFSLHDGSCKSGLGQAQKLKEVCKTRQQRKRKNKQRKNKVLGFRVSHQRYEIKGPDTSMQFQEELSPMAQAKHRGKSSLKKAVSCAGEVSEGCNSNSTGAPSNWVDLGPRYGGINGPTKHMKVPNSEAQNLGGPFPYPASFYPTKPTHIPINEADPFQIDRIIEREEAGRRIKASLYYKPAPSPLFGVSRNQLKDHVRNSKVSDSLCAQEHAQISIQSMSGKSSQSPQMIGQMGYVCKLVDYESDCSIGKYYEGCPNMNELGAEVVPYPELHEGGESSSTGSVSEEDTDTESEGGSSISKGCRSRVHSSSAKLDRIRQAVSGAYSQVYLSSEVRDLGKERLNPGDAKVSSYIGPLEVGQEVDAPQSVREIVPHSDHIKESFQSLQPMRVEITQLDMGEGQSRAWTKEKGVEDLTVSDRKPESVSSSLKQRDCHSSQYVESTIQLMPKDQKEISNWVLSMLPKFGTFLGLSYEGHEKEVLEMFQCLEKSLCKGPASANKESSGDKVCHTHRAALSAQPALVENEKKLLEKINILCLMEIIFRRPSEDRTIPLNIIAERIKLTIKDVENLLIKSL
ncbi:hypothetical protein HHK36_007894 [Tetracentron sinense]|uniref:DUF4283 domain-containing protein n=1 Tax=Tetracentron sinense TaxID=13715 RepID=A0A834ZP51_TETSI|nr:hypothetical protein HHK36_007894 [Tetracentron sinense]